MKKMILVILMTAAAAMAFGGSLSVQAEIIREKMPETFQAMRDRATEEWGTDAAMVVWELNRQAESMFAVLGNDNNNEQLLNSAILEWSDPGYLGQVSDEYAMGRVDWAMVEFEYNRQASALSALD